MQVDPKAAKLFDVGAEDGLDAQIAELMAAQGGGADAALLAALATCAHYKAACIHTSMRLSSWARPRYFL